MHVTPVLSVARVDHIGITVPDLAEAHDFFAACLRGEPTPAQVAAAVTALRTWQFAPATTFADDRLRRVLNVVIAAVFDCAITPWKPPEPAARLAPHSWRNRSRAQHRTLLTAGAMFRLVRHRLQPGSGVVRAALRLWQEVKENITAGRQ